MRKKREFVEGAAYHVTSRTNDKIRVFERNLGRKSVTDTRRYHVIQSPRYALPLPGSYRFPVGLSVSFHR
jgi:hypothetical protein